MKFSTWRSGVRYIALWTAISRRVCNDTSCRQSVCMHVLIDLCVRYTHFSALAPSFIPLFRISLCCLFSPLGHFDIPVLDLELFLRRFL